MTLGLHGRPHWTHQPLFCVFEQQLVRMCKHRPDATKSHSGPFNDRSVSRGFNPEMIQKLTQSLKHKISSDSIGRVKHAGGLFPNHSEYKRR